MSDDTDYVAQAESLIDTYNAISDPTLDDLNTLTSGVASILNSSSITEDEIVSIVADLTTVLESSTYTSSDFTFFEIESSQMTTDMNKEFLSIISFMFMNYPQYSNLMTDANGEINSYAEATTTISYEEYESLWTSISDKISSYVSSDDLNSMQTLYTAALKMMFDLNYSNLMSKFLDTDTISTYLMSTLIPNLISTYPTELNSSYVIPTILNFYTEVSSTGEGLSTLEFISASKQTLGYLLAFLQNSDIASIKSELTSYISENFFSSTSFASNMALPSATSLTSSVSSNFSIGALPLTPPQATSLYIITPLIIGSYNFSDSDFESIVIKIDEFFATTGYQTRGLTAAQIGSLWDLISNEISLTLSDNSDSSDLEPLTFIKTIYTNTVSSLVSKNINDALSSSNYYDADILETAYTFVNPITGETENGTYMLFDWLETFIDNIASDLGGVNAVVLKLCLGQMFSAGNSTVYDGFNLVLGSKVSGYNLMQIMISTLDFLSNFLDQTQLDNAAQDFMEYFSLFVGEYDKLNQIEADLEIFQLAASAVVLIIATIATAGLASTLSSTLSASLFGAEVSIEGASSGSFASEFGSMIVLSDDLIEEGESINDAAQEGLDIEELSIEAEDGSLDSDNDSLDDESYEDILLGVQSGSEQILDDPYLSNAIANAEEIETILSAITSNIQAAKTIATVVGIVSFMGLSGLAYQAYNIVIDSDT